MFGSEVNSLSSYCHLKVQSLETFARCIFLTVILDPIESTMTLQETRERPKAHFSNNSASDPRKWSELWDNGDFLPWDRGLPNPASEDLLIERKDLLGPGFVESANGAEKPKKALVPGCGRGYDVLLLASFGYDTVGLEVSQAAVKQCYEMMEAQLDKYHPRQGTVSGEVNFLVGDFFGDEWIRKSGLAEEGGKFDLIYDYTV